MNKIAYVTLGCPKNQVDTEELAETISHYGFGYTESLNDADACIINTCCFIDDAKRESIEMILEIASQKRNGSKLIVIGCMGQKYRNELIKEIPEIEVVFGVNDVDNILAYIKSSLKSDEMTTQPAIDPKLPYHYIKIADGCSRSCSFCVIPSIRGKFRSQRPDDILYNVKRNLEKGVKEIILVAQDITGYGRDCETEFGLSNLVRNIAELDGDFWLRLLYLYPAGVNKDLIQVMAEEDKVCNYFDIPVQHSDDTILRSMKRGYTRKEFLDTVSYIRRSVEDPILRTSLIVGYPGESDEQFNGLKEFVKQVEFDRLGVFKYSPQEGTYSYGLGIEVPASIKEDRFHEIMTIQSEISARKNADLVGNTMRALVDDVEDKTCIARLYSHAPDIDGEVIIRSCSADRLGQFITVRITDAYDYDLAGEMINGQ